MKDKMKYVRVSDIQVDDRFRLDYGNMDELKSSIKEKGILQPITLSGDLHLLAGGRRFRAASELELKEVPALIRTIDGEIDAREIELVENIHRKDFTWQEQAKLISRIHDLYKKKDPEWSGRSTAELLDKNPMTVSRALNLAAGMSVLPQLEDCKTADEASKLMKKAEEQSLVSELARRQKTKINEAVKSGRHDPVQAVLHRAQQDYIIGDVFDGLAKLKTNGNFYLIECDPPYGIDLTKGSGNHNTTDSVVKKQLYKTYKEVSKKDYPGFLERLTTELYRVAGPVCWMTFWFSMNWYREVVDSLEGAGWQVDKTPAIWLKGNRSKSMNKDCLTRGYETFLVCKKGHPIIQKVGHTNTFMWSHDDNAYHPSQRPVKLMKDLIEIFALPTSHILVPFAGSGATLRAAYIQGNFVLGFDDNPEYKDRYLLEVEKDTRKMLEQDTLPF